MTSPHVDLGNSLQDVGQGANTFAAGLLAQRQRQQQIAIQQALADSKNAVDQATIAHTNAETNQTIPAQAGQMTAQTGDINAQAAARQAETTPADDQDEAQLRIIDPTAPRGIFQGHNKAQAANYVKVLGEYLATKNRINMSLSEYQNRGVPTTDVNGNTGIIRPNQPNGGGFEPIPANPGSPGAPNSTGVPIGKPLSGADRKAAGAGQAALSAKNDMQHIMRNNPEVAAEIAKALTLPNIGRLSFIPGTGDGVQQILDSFRFAGVSPQAQVFLKRMFDFTGIVGPTRYGLRGMQNPRTLMQLWSDFGLGQFGLTHEGIQAAMRNQDNAVNQLQEMSGPNAWSQAQGVFPQTQSTIGAVTTSPYGYQKR